MSSGVVAACDPLQTLAPPLVFTHDPQDFGGRLARFFVLLLFKTAPD
jgi:hypothetical protein